MKYIVKRNNFKSGLIKVDEQIKKSEQILEKSGDWRETYDELPNWKDSAVGRLLSFITRKSVEKVQGLRVNRLLNNLEEALNINVIDELSKDEKFKKVVDKTEKASFFKALFNRIKNIQNKKDVEKVKDIIEDAKSENASYVEDIPNKIQILIQILDNRTINIINNNEKETNQENKSFNNKSESEDESSKEKANNTNNANINTNINNSSFIEDLINSKDPVEFLRDSTIRKQFFIELKQLLGSNFGQILISYLDKSVFDDLNKLSIFIKKETKNAGTESEKEEQRSSLVNKEQSKEESLKRQQELKNKRLEKQKEAGVGVNKNLSKRDKIDSLKENVDSVDSDSLSLREGSLKKLIQSLKKFFADKRIKANEVIDRFFKKTNKLYNTYLGNDNRPENPKELNKTEEKPDTQSLLPVLYKKLTPDEIEFAEEVNDSIDVTETGLVKYDSSKIKNIQDSIDSQIKSEVEETKKSVEDDAELEKKAENLEKNETAIDPLEVVKIFNRASKMMVVNYMPSNRSGGNVSRRVANDYETLDGGAPSLQNNNGPYRNKNLWDKWNNGVLDLLKKYQERLRENKYIIYKENGDKEIKKANAPISKFINDMLNDSKSTGTKGSKHQTDFVEAYFGIKEEYLSKYKDKFGDPFSTNKQGGKELQTESKSNTASFTSVKSGGGKIDKIVVSKMRDKNAGYAFSLKGNISGYPKYEGKRAAMYCLGIKTYGKDFVLFKMSFNNDWFIRAYKANLDYNTETEEAARTNVVFLMLLPYNAELRNEGKFTARIMPCAKAEDIQTTATYTIEVSNIDDIDILHGADGYMMKMDGRPDEKKKSSKDIFYAKDETFNNILNRLTSK